MNRVLTILAVVALAAVIVGWRIWSQSLPHHMAAQGSLPPVAAGLAPESAVPETPAPSPTVPSLPEAGSTPLAANDSADLSTAVLLERHGCRVSDQRFDPDTAQMRDVYDCPSRQSDPHPYESWSNEALTSLAYGDPKAAEVLGLRHVVSTEPGTEALGLALLYRSVALSADPDVFHEAIGRRYAYLSVNGEPQLHNLRQLLVFSIIGRQLGGPDFDPAPIEGTLRQTDIPQEEIAQLHAAARQILKSMGDLQREVTGNTSIVEAIADV